jgi:branched-chain amino acid transport system substrate-binding protein/urea transport system substrate-binding protein
MKVRNWIIFCSVSLFIFCAGFGIAGAADKEPINIGVIASLTGYLSDQAENVVQGTELAVDEINGSGGLLGRPIKIHSRDDEMKPPVGARRFEDLVKNQGIVMHSGVVFAPIASSIQQSNKQLGDKGVVLFQAATNSMEQDPKNMQPNLFFAGSSLEAYGLVAGEHMPKNFGKKTVILYADYAGWGWVIRDAFIKNATANGTEILGAIAIPPGTTDYQPFLTQVMAKKPDYATFIINAAMFINCMKQAYGMGLKDKMKFVTFHVNIEEVNGCGPEVIKDVVMVTDYFWNIQTDKNKAFVEKYLKKYGSSKRPSQRHFLHYASVKMWADVVKKVGTVDPKAVAAGLLGFKEDYGMGEMRIRTTGDHTTIKPVVVARGKGPGEMKDKFDTQEIVKIYSGEQYFYSAKEKGH